MSQVLSGRRIFTGTSKGGFTTNVQAYLYPDDADAFVSYVAPLCNGTQDPRACKNIYETIGDNGMTQEQAKEYRDLILQFQVECIKNRTALVQRNHEYYVAQGYTFSEDDNIIFDMQVNDFAAEEWQLFLDFDKISAILQMKDGDEKVQSIWDILNDASDSSSYSQQSLFFPYYVQAATQMGENAIDFSYLRAALTAAYEEAKAKDPTTSEDLYKLAVTPDMDGNLLWDTMFTAEQQVAFQYDDTLRNELISWSQTTTAHVVMIYGGVDVWYPTRIPDVDNPSIYRYVAPALNHRVRISDLTESEQAELRAALNGWLTDSTEPAAEAATTNVLADTSAGALPFPAAFLMLSGVGACCVLMSRCCCRRKE